MGRFSRIANFFQTEVIGPTPARFMFQYKRTMNESNGSSYKAPDSAGFGPVSL